MKYFLVLIIRIIIGFYFNQIMDGYSEKITVLNEPLSLDGDTQGLLPKGTTLYYVGHNGGESFERYKVYINVNGKKFDLKQTEHHWEISPINAWPKNLFKKKNN